MAKPRNTGRASKPAKPSTSTEAPKRKPGRPARPDTQPLPPVTGIRFPVELLERVDAFVDERNAELATEGLTTNRNAIIVRFVREALDAHAAKKGNA